MSAVRARHRPPTFGKEEMSGGHFPRKFPSASEGRRERGNVRGTFSPKVPERKRGATERGNVRGTFSPKVPERKRGATGKRKCPGDIFPESSRAQARGDG